MLSPKIRIFLGVTTVLVFMGIGGTMYADGQHTMGGVLLALGLFRVVVLVRQWRAYTAEDDE